MAWSLRLLMVECGAGLNVSEQVMLLVSLLDLTVIPDGLCGLLGVRRYAAHMAPIFLVITDMLRLLVGRNTLLRVSISVTAHQGLGGARRADVSYVVQLRILQV